MKAKLNELLFEIEEYQKEYNRVNDELKQIKTKYRIQLDGIERKLDECYKKISDNELIKVSIGDLVEKLMCMHNKDAKVEVVLNEIFVSSLKPHEGKKEALEKIKDDWKKLKRTQIILKSKDDKDLEVLFAFRIPLYLSSDTVLNDGSKFMDNLSYENVDIRDNTIFGSRAGIVRIPEETVLKINVNFDYKDLLDNSIYNEEDCYPNVKMLRDAIFNILNKKKTNNVKR